MGETDSQGAGGHLDHFLLYEGRDRLVRGFLRLKDDEARRKVADLVDWLASVS